MIERKWCVILLIGSIFVAGFSSGFPITIWIIHQGQASPLKSQDARSGGLSHSDVVEWSEITSFVYLLQDMSVDALAQAKADLAIIDYSLDGTADGELTPTQVNAIKSSGYPKKVISYLSIGEAESYRYYWNDSWHADPPEWLDEENPDWEGNYKVRYWYPEWQAIVFDYLDKIISAGFDGVYLDIIDAYWYYHDEMPNSDLLMMDFVIKIAEHARNITGDPNWGIFPQNAEELTHNKTYLNVITGIGREDVFLLEDDSDTKRPRESLKPIIDDLLAIKDSGKLVLTIDYTRVEDLIRYVYQQAREHGFVAYVTDRALNRITLHHTTLLNDQSSTTTTLPWSWGMLVLFLMSVVTMILSKKNQRKKIVDRFFRLLVFFHHFLLVVILACVNKSCSFVKVFKAPSFESREVPRSDIPILRNGKVVLVVSFSSTS